MEVTERWEPIRGHKGYLISDHGRAMSGRNGKFLCPCRTSSGYLYIKCQGQNICIHKAVADAFVPKPESDKRLVVHHKDGNKDNNYYSNLIWLSDASHMEIHGLAESVRERQRQMYVGEDENGKIRKWNSREEAREYFSHLSNDEFTFAYLWKTRVSDKDGMTWQLHRVLEIQDGKGNIKWKSPRTVAQTKNERRVLDNYIKQQLGE